MAVGQENTHVIERSNSSHNRKTILERIRKVRYFVYAGSLILFVILLTGGVIVGLYTKQHYIITIFVPLAVLVCTMNLLCVYYYEYLDRRPKWGNTRNRQQSRSPNNVGNHIIYNMNLTALYQCEDELTIMMNSLLPSYEEAMAQNHLYGKFFLT